MEQAETLGRDTAREPGGRTRYFITLSYDGTAYHGWQIQPQSTSVQEQLQRALSTLLRRPVEVVGAGRTDTGVHARKMVAHFDSDATVEIGRAHV